MNIKKIIFLLGFLTTVFLSDAQDFASPASAVAYNSLYFSQVNPILGTARYSGMGGAMGALGGDASTMKDNPAGLGLYRSSDLTFSPNFYIANDNSVGFNINNFAFILNLRNSGKQTGYVTSSLGVSYNRLKNFNRYSDLGDDFSTNSMTDYMTDYATDALYTDAFKLKLIDNEGSLFGFNPETGDFDGIGNQTRYSERGSVEEWNFSYGMNISNRFYLGLSTGIVNLDYRSTVLYDEWSANDRNEYWFLDTYYEATGSGINFKIGAIAALTDYVRVGLAFHTPTFYSVKEYFSEDIGYKDDYFDDPRESSYRSNLQTPLKLQGSLGFIIGKRAVVGLEYQFENFSAMRISSDGILDQASKNLINSEMGITHTAKAGVEVKVVEGLSLRAGFAYASSPSIQLKEKDYDNPEYFQPYPLVQPQNTFYYTGGIGYKGKYFYADLAYMHQAKKEILFPYLPQQEFAPYDLTLHNHNITATLGFRF